MLTGITLYNELGKNIMTLPVFGATPDSRYIVKDVEGLDPVKAVLASSETAILDGVVMHNSRVGMRNIVMTLGFNPDVAAGESVAALRRELYSQFPPKSAITMRFLSDDFQTLRIVGITESIEGKIFSRDPEVIMSVVCAKPYFEAITASTHRYVNTFEYIDLPELGSAPTGFIFKTDPLPESIDAVVLENSLNPKLDVVGPFITNDVVTISTEPGNKYVRRTRTGTTVSLLDDITTGSLDMYLDGRTPAFRFSTRQSGGGIYFNMTYTPKFVGL